MEFLLVQNQDNPIVRRPIAPAACAISLPRVGIFSRRMRTPAVDQESPPPSTEATVCVGASASSVNNLVRV